MCSTSGFYRQWQDKGRTQLIAVALGVLPIYLGLIILQLAAEQRLSIHAFTMYLVVISPLSIVITLLLLRFFCGERPRDLNLKPGKLPGDLLGALALSVVIIVASVTSTFILSGLLPESASNESIKNLFRELTADTGLFVLFVGPLFLLGAASEELIRVFLLSRLWKVWPSTTARLTVIVISACLFGLIHLYQGPVAVCWKVIFGVIMALYYLWFGRLVPLILAHYLTNALQAVVFFAVAQ